jgi:hypothetical protein
MNEWKIPEVTRLDSGDAGGLLKSERPCNHLSVRTSCRTYTHSSSVVCDKVACLTPMWIMRATRLFSMATVRLTSTKPSWDNSTTIPKRRRNDILFRYTQVCDIIIKGGG